MTIRTTARLGTAVVVALALLVATALPASAVAHTLKTEASSTITINGTSTHFGGHQTAYICAANSNPAISFPTDWDHTTGVGVANPVTTDWTDYTLGGNTYKSRLVVGNGGVVNVTSNTISVTVNVTIQFRSCDSLTPLCSTNILNVTLSGNHNSGTIAIPASTKVTLLGNVHVTAPFTCNPVIRAAINSQVANFSVNVEIN